MIFFIFEDIIITQPVYKKKAKFFEDQIKVEGLSGLF